MSSHSGIPQVPRKSPPPGRFARAAQLVGIVGYSLCGVVVTATPLVLWMTWSGTSYVLTLLAGFLGCCGIVVLSRFLPEHRQAERRERDGR